MEAQKKTFENSSRQKQLKALIIIIQQTSIKDSKNPRVLQEEEGELVFSGW